MYVDHYNKLKDNSKTKHCISRVMSGFRTRRGLDIQVCALIPRREGGGQGGRCHEGQRGEDDVIAIELYMYTLI